MSKSKSSPFVRLLHLVSLLLIVIAGLLCITAYRIVRFGQKESASNTDVAIVLGAAAWGNRPSPIYRQRIEHAVRLYQSGRVRWIIFTGGTRSESFPSEAQVGSHFAFGLGVPMTSILVDNQSHTTWENLTNAKTLMANNGLKSALLVSDPLHMMRGCTLAQALGMQVDPAPTSSSRVQSWESWTRFLWHETLSYVVYQLSGKPDNEALIRH